MKRNIFRIYIFVLIFSPLAFGTVERWSLTIMETLSLLAVGLLIMNNIRRKASFFYDVPGTVPLMLFLSYMLVQLVPLPPGLLLLVSPGTYAVYHDTVWTTGPLTWLPLSLNRKATLSEFFRIASYAAFYVLTVQLLVKKDLLKRTVVLIIVFVSALSFFGIVQHFLSNNKIFWIRELTQGGVPFGPYVNRNHYAGLVGMIFPLALSLFLFYRPGFRYGALRERITEIFNQHVTNVHLLLGFSALLMATSIFVSLSRGGILSLIMALIFLGGMILNKEKKSRKGVLVVLIVVLLAYSVGWFGWNSVFERFESIRNAQGDISELRFEIWKDSINIIKDFPVTGTGFGSLISVYPKYRTISGAGIVDHAHNDYIELFTDGGIIGVLLFSWFLIAVFYGSYRVFLKRRDPYAAHLYIGAISGLAAILIHSITDFNLHIGANGLYLFFLLGLLISAANTRVHDGQGHTYLHKAQLPLMKPFGFLMVPVLLLNLAINIGDLMGKYSFAAIQNSPLGPHLSGEELYHMRDVAYRASAFDPWEPQYHYAVANTEWLSSHRDIAVYHYQKAVSLSPLNGDFLQTLGLVMSHLKQYGAADRLFRAGISSDPRNPVRYKRYGSWLLARDNKESAMGYIKTAISLEPEKTRDYITLLVLYGLSDSKIRDALPDLVEPHILFADYLDGTGKDGSAEEEYLSALEYTKNEKEVSPSYFYRAYQYYISKHMPDEALMVMQKAVAALPRNAGLRVSLAELYEKNGIPYRAAEEYRQAIIIDPKNEMARKKLNEIK
jgi:O-antigen ligase/Tfp pilus assembly protein PilF